MSKVTLEGLEGLQESLKALGEAVSENLPKALLAGGYVLESKIKIDMAAPKSGRVYGKHTASAPGESPAIDTSDLANSVMTEADGEDVLVGTNNEYAEPLEFGTVRMAARPFMGPAAETYKDDVQAAAQAVIKAAIEGASGV